VENIEDLAGLWRKSPKMAGFIALAAGSFVGMPPLIGFWGKLMIFIAGIESGEILLISIAAVNSAISAWYYLHIAGVPVVRAATPRSETVIPTNRLSPKMVATLAGLSLIIVPIFTTSLYEYARTGMDMSELEVPASKQTFAPNEETPLHAMAEKKSA
jgi:NADH-quinone oxidoreductase subunit N